jgi:hypothetical protein
MPDELELARCAAVALEQECAMLADNLELFTHEYRPDFTRQLECVTCDRRADATVHRTPAFLRRRHGFGI